MDGTLIDTEPLWAQATYELGELLGRRPTPEVRGRTIGGSFPNTLRIVADWAGHTLADGDVDRYRDWMFARMAELFAGGIECNPGIPSVLASLNAEGVPMYVTTNTERVLADPCIDAIGRGFFAGSITGDEVAHPKPAPDMYLEAARRAGAQPEECLVVEDSFTGMSAGAAAGCAVLGLADDVPAGVYRFDPANFVDTDAGDVYRWFSAARQG